MFQTSKMILDKSVTRIKGKTRNSDYMSNDNYNHKEGNAIGDISDLQITRTFMTDSYTTSEWIRAIVDRASDRISQIELFPMPLSSKVRIKDGSINNSAKKHMENIMNLLMKPNNDNESFKAIVGKIVKDLLIYDEAGVQIVKADKLLEKNVPYHLYANVSGEELYVNPKKNGVLPDRRTYLQLKNGVTEVASWNKNDFMNFIKNRRAGYSNGISPIETLATSIMGDFESMNFNLKFFENNARPDMAFIFENLGFGKGKSALDKAKKWYLENHQGRPYLPLFMGSEKGQVKLQDLKYTHKDMEFIDWQSFLLERIMAVYGMQPVVLVSGNRNRYIDAQIQTEQFKKNMVIPILDIILYTINCTLLWNEYNYNYTDIYMASTKLDIEDENKQAEIDEKYLDRGVITINQVRNRLQMQPVPWGNLPFVPLNYAPYDILKKYQVSKIKSNLQRAMSDKIDNNVNVSKNNKKDDNNKNDEVVNKERSCEDIYGENGMLGLYSALYGDDDFSSNVFPYLLKNFKMPTGLEKEDSRKVIDICCDIIKRREKELSKTFSFPNFDKSKIINVANDMDLEWGNILRTRE